MQSKSYCHNHNMFIEISSVMAPNSLLKLAIANRIIAVTLTVGSGLEWKWKNNVTERAAGKTWAMKLANFSAALFLHTLAPRHSEPTGQRGEPQKKSLTWKDTSWTCGNCGVRVHAPSPARSEGSISMIPNRVKDRRASRDNWPMWSIDMRQWKKPSSSPKDWITSEKSGYLMRVSSPWGPARLGQTTCSKSKPSLTSKPRSTGRLAVRPSAISSS
mmetsp:Transcript_95939/g.293450  ORF Transcript_95939/g.293450 Transcript_95939/m.293450 type:complete len:216 (-) Transcript_95939:458-1105(-)